MPIAYPLNGLNGHHIANDLLRQQFFQLLIENGIAKHMADNHLSLIFICEPFDIFAFLPGGGNRLFQQNMIAFVERCHRLGIMCSVPSADE